MTLFPARPWRWLAAATVLCSVAGLSSPAAAQPLAVPFLPQTEDLCGGAAAAMVMRYWGAADVYPDAFAPLVDHSAGGIKNGALVSDLERRGWTAAAGAGSAAEITKELARGRPVIALIEDRPGRFHYVVVVGWTADRVTLHDPARGPSRDLPASRFDEAWQKSDRWMLILLPPPEGPTKTPAADAASVAEPGMTAGVPSACEVRVREAVAQADSDRASARAALGRVTEQCANVGGAWRELAGLDALEQKWPDAAAHAERAIALDAHDSYAWRILATARYVQHDDRGALAAWNHLGEPIVNLIDVKGLRHTRYDVVANAIGVELKTMLTPAALERAERRVRDVPAIAAARLAYRPVENGHAQIDASILERDRLPSGYPALLKLGVDAATEREVSAALTNVSGGGDAAGGVWRWWEHRPMVSAFYAAPAPRAIGGGIWRLDVSRETQTFGTIPFEETRTRAAMTLGTWLTGRTRLIGTAAVERWHDRPGDVAVSGGIEHWRFANRVRLALEGMQAAGPRPFSSARATAAIRSKTSSTGFVAVAAGGYALASRTSPASIWPGADTGHARDVLLRAHPLLDDGIIRDGAFGRRLAFGSIEAQRWTTLRKLPVRWAPAVFVDSAQATHGLPNADSRLFVDAGVGLRLSLPGATVMRLDLAHGLRDGGLVLSAGWDWRFR